MERKTPRRVRRAFTLVELLVVIGIIALLIGILLPALSQARKHANEVACASNLHQMGIALLMYTNEYGYYPGCRATGLTHNVGGDYAVWPTRLRIYMGRRATDTANGSYSQGVFRCPEQSADVYEWKVNDTTSPVADKTDTGYGYNVGERLLMENDASSYGAATHFSYGYNDWGSYDPNDPLGLAIDPALQAQGIHQKGLGSDIDNPLYPQVKASFVKKASLVIAIADNTPDGKFDFNIDPRDFTQAPGVVHHGGANFLYCDGHVVWHTLKDVALFNLKTHLNYSTLGPQYQAIAPQWNYDAQP